MTDNDTPVSFIAPLTITSAMITSSTAVTHLASEVEWTSTGSYTVGQVVFRSNFSRRFESRFAGVDAAGSPPENDQTRWYDLGSTDKTTMFDAMVGTQSIAPNTLTSVVSPGAFNSGYLAGLEGATLSVTLKAAPGGAVVYSLNASLEASEVSDYYDHFFAPFRPKTDYTLLNIPPYATGELTITVSNPGGVARIGMASLGDLVSLGGPAEKGARVKVKSYSTFDTTPKGVTTIEKGRKARDLTATVTVDIDQASNIADDLDKVADTPCAVIGSDMYTLRQLRTFGILNYELVFNNVDATFNISVQGTT